MSNLEKFQPDRDGRLDKLFGDVPLETDSIVKIPSLGKFYLNGTPEITISPIKFEDEKNLSINAKNGINPINLILTKCVKNFDINSLLLIDKIILLLKIREISYGETYPARVICPKCEAESEININLNELIVRTIPEDILDPREITLPKLKKKVKVRFPRISDEQFLNTQEQVYSNIWRFVVEIDGTSDPVFISKAIPRMHIMDIKFILKHIMRSDLGLDPKFILQCGSCGGESEMSVPINENFFSVI